MLKNYLIFSITRSLALLLREDVADWSDVAESRVGVQWSHISEYIADAVRDTGPVRLRRGD